MHPALQTTAHRPWPLPPRAWRWRQTWSDLLFAHWPMPVSVLRPFVPPALTIQEFDGTSWIGIVPFRMSGVMHRPLPDVPGVSAFAELNLRLYVEADGKPGVWFISLDAANSLAVWAARRLFDLAYFRADMTGSAAGARIHYKSTRRGGGVTFRGSYWPTSAPQAARPGTLEHFLVERYCCTPRGQTA